MQALTGYAIGSAAFVGGEWLDPTLLLQAGNRPIQRSRTQTSSAKARDIFDHCVSMLRSTGQAGKHEQRRIRIVPRSLAIPAYSYVLRTSHNVVMTQLARKRK